MKVKFMNFKEMAITQNTGMCSYLTIAWAVPNDVCDIWLSRENSFAIRFFFSVYTQLASQILFI